MDARLPLDPVVRLGPNVGKVMLGIHYLRSFHALTVPPPEHSGDDPASGVPATTGDGAERQCAHQGSFA